MTAIFNRIIVLESYLVDEIKYGSFLSKNRPTEKCIFLPITTAYSVELNIKEKQYENLFRNVSISVDKKSGVEDMKRQIIHEKCHIINVPTCQIMEVYKERWFMPLKNKFVLGKAANINILLGSESNYAGDVLRQIEYDIHKISTVASWDKVS